MKKQFGFIFFFCAYTISYSQYMPVLDADTTEYTILAEIFDATIESEVFILGDTTIEDKVYRQVWSGTETPPIVNQVLVGFIREDVNTGKLWFRRLRDVNENLVMDLSLNVGDSFQILDEYLSCSNSGIAPVKRIDTVDRRKIITLDCIYGGGIIYDTLRFIEGVGSNASIFFQTLDINVDANREGIFSGFAYNMCRMFKEDMLFYSQMDVMCEATTPIYTTRADLKTRIFPNPTNGKIFIETEARINSLQLFNISGKLLKTVKDTQIDLSSFKQGMYILKVLHNSKRVTTHKVLKI